MQTLANLSSSRDVLRQVEINNAALARLEGYYANYKEALIHQLDQKKPDLLEALNPITASISTTSLSSAGGAGAKAPTRRQPSGSIVNAGSIPVESSAAGSPVNTGRPPSASMAINPSAGVSGGGKLTSAPSFNLGGMRRRKSLRESIGGGDNALMATVNTLAAKVVSSNDRYLCFQCKWTRAMERISESVFCSFLSFISTVYFVLICISLFLAMQRQ